MEPFPDDIFNLADVVLRVSREHPERIAVIDLDGWDGHGVRRYLLWTRLQGDEGRFVAETVLPETDHDAVRIMTVHAAKGLQLVKDIDATLPNWLSGDALRLEQSLLNYLGNAIKFSEQGKVSVSVCAQEEDIHSLLLRIEVSDQAWA